MDGGEAMETSGKLEQTDSSTASQTLHQAHRDFLVVSVIIYIFVAVNKKRN